MKPGNEISAHNIRFLREMEKLTQHKFAVKYGTTQKSIWTYENGLSRPNAKFMFKLSEMTGLSGDTLFSLKLEKDETGKIKDLKTTEEQAMSLRHELDMLTYKYKKESEKFFEGIKTIHDRLAEIEKNQ